MKKRFILGLTVLIYLFVFISPAYAATEAELQQQKNAAAAAKEAAQYKVDTTQTTIDGIEQEIKKANTAIETISGQISDLDDKIADLGNSLKRTTAELKAAEEKQVKQEEEFHERIRVMYMYGNEGYMAVLFSATDFADFIAKADMMKSVVHADKDVAKALEKTKNEVIEKKASIEDNKKQVEVAKADQETALKSQESIKVQKDELLSKNEVVIKDYKNEVQAQQAVYEKADNSLAEIAKQKEAEANRIREEKRRQQEEQRRVEEEQRRVAEEERKKAEAEQENNSGSNSGGSSSTPAPAPSTPAPSNGLIWPISSAYYPDEWDDMFGDRIHPVYGSWTWHSGCDMGAPGGTDVWAPGDGVVTFAGWNGGYGKCVMVAVDGGTVLFGHLSSINVSEGQYVSQGEVVGGVGTTGTSTGNHLHLSFMVNGGYVNPLNYMHW